MQRPKYPISHNKRPSAHFLGAVVVVVVVVVVFVVVL